MTSQAWIAGREAGYNEAKMDALLECQLTPQDIRLRASEMTAQEMRTVRAVLKSVWHEIDRMQP